MKIKVTKKDIDDGFGGGCYSCPVALALRRKVKLKQPYVWCVWEDSIVIEHRRHIATEVKSPGKVARFVSRFDQEEPVKPFEFEIKIPGIAKYRESK